MAPPMWDRLPDLILTHVFVFLNRRDRVAASEVCTSWNRALSCPSLWRHMSLRLDRDLLMAPDSQLSPNEPLAIYLVHLYGQHMHRLDLIWSRPFASPLQTFPRLPRGAQAEAGAAFLYMIRTQDLQLRELFLVDWVYSYKWGSRSKLLFSLANFLSSQKNLDVLSIQNACLGFGEAMRLMAAVIRSCGNVLRNLDLRGAFREWQAPHTSPRYLELLGRLIALSSICLDYSALSDAVLTTLSDSTKDSLKHMHVVVRDTDNRQHALSDRAWNQLGTACHNLRVAFTVVNIAHYEDLCYFLLPSIPLNNFRLFSGSVWDQSRSRNFRSTVRLLLSYYSHTLESVHLHLKNNREMLDDLLLQMLSQCCLLSNLQYDGVLRNMDTVRKICNMQLDLKTNFHTLHVRPRNLNTVNRSIVRDICSNYVNKLAEQTVDLRIEDTSPVILFC